MAHKKKSGNTAGMKIINLAKRIRKAHPGKKWISAMKEAGKEYKSTHKAPTRTVGAAPKKHKAKKTHRVGASREVGKDRVDNKRVHITVGTISEHKRELVNHYERRLMQAWLAVHNAKNKTDRKKKQKFVTHYKKQLSKLLD